MAGDKLYYFAYASNLSHKQMAFRCPDSKFIGLAVLDDYKFVYDGYSETRRGAVANVVPAEGERVIGGLYEISEADLASLDMWEVNYVRKTFAVRMSDGTSCEAVTYSRGPLPTGKPSDEYVAVINEGKRDCGIEVPAETVQLS